MSKKPTVFAVGSTVYDIVFGSRQIEELGDVKDNAEISYMATGGGGANFALALDALRRHTRTPMDIVLGTRLGYEASGNRMQLMAREQIGLELKDIRIIDAIGDLPFTIPVNNVNLTNKGRHIFTQFSEAALCISAGVEQEFVATAHNASLVFLNTRFPRIAGITGHAAFDAGVPVVLDYSIESPDNSSFDMEVLERAAYVFAPGEARVKGMPDFDKNDPVALQKNADLLYEKFAEMGIRNFAISSGKQPVVGMSNGVRFQHDVPDVPRIVDKLAVGDGRNACAVLDLVQQMQDGKKAFELDLEQASIRSAGFASFTLMYPGRDWTAHLDRFEPRKEPEAFSAPAPPAF